MSSHAAPLSVLSDENVREPRLHIERLTPRTSSHNLNAGDDRRITIKLHSHFGQAQARPRHVWRASHRNGGPLVLLETDFIRADERIGHQSFDGRGVVIEERFRHFLLNRYQLLFCRPFVCLRENTSNEKNDACSGDNELYGLLVSPGR